jgi:hypothetical protein
LRSVVSPPHDVRTTFSLLLSKDDYPALTKYIETKNAQAATEIIYKLEGLASGLLFKTAHVVDVLDETQKAIEWGKAHISSAHEKAEGLIQDTSYHVCICCVHPPLPIMLTTSSRATWKSCPT